VLGCSSSRRSRIKGSWWGTGRKLAVLEAVVKQECRVWCLIRKEPPKDCVELCQVV
jgi:hypothetical protein